jgi:hypothetical protein
MLGGRGHIRTMRLLPFAAAAGRGCVTSLEGCGYRVAVQLESRSARVAAAREWPSGHAVYSLDRARSRLQRAPAR